MTRKELVKFLTENYEPDEQLVWQTVSLEDVANDNKYATPEAWLEFIEKLDNHNELAEIFSKMTTEAFYDWLYNPEQEEEDNV